MGTELQQRLLSGRPSPRGLATTSMWQPPGHLSTALSASRLRMHSVFCSNGRLGKSLWQVPFLLCHRQLPAQIPQPVQVMLYEKERGWSDRHR